MRLVGTDFLLAGIAAMLGDVGVTRNTKRLILSDNVPLSAQLTSALPADEVVHVPYATLCLGALFAEYELKRTPLIGERWNLLVTIELLQLHLRSL